MGPIKGLFQSRKFWVFLSTAGVDLVLYFVAKYAAWAVDDVTVLIGFITALGGVLIGAISYEDGQMKRANGGLDPAKVEKAISDAIAEAIKGA